MMSAPEEVAPRATGKSKRAKVTRSIGNGRKARTPKPASTTTAKPEHLVDEVEAGIDELIFILTLNGGMPEVEEALRAARRMLTRSNGAD